MSRTEANRGAPLWPQIIAYVMGFAAATWGLALLVGEIARANGHWPLSISGSGNELTDIGCSLAILWIVLLLPMLVVALPIALAVRRLALVRKAHHASFYVLATPLIMAGVLGFLALSLPSAGAIFVTTALFPMSTLVLAVAAAIGGFVYWIYARDHPPISIWAAKKAQIQIPRRR